MTSSYQFRYSNKQDLAPLLSLTLELTDTLGVWGTPDNSTDEEEGELTAMDHLVFNATCPFYRYYICTREEELVGFVWFGQSDADRTEAFVDGLYVKEKHRRQGIALFLMKEALAWIRNANCQSVVLLVNPKNRSAISLYEGLGFTRKEDEEDAYTLVLRENCPKIPEKRGESAP